MESGWFVVLGAIIGIVPTLLIAWWNQRAEKDRHLRQLATELALTEYKAKVEHIKTHPGIVSPAMVYLAPAYACVKILLNRDIKPQDFAGVYAEISDLIEKNKEWSLHYFGPNKKTEGTQD